MYDSDEREYDLYDDDRGLFDDYPNQKDDGLIELENLQEKALLKLSRLERQVALLEECDLIDDYTGTMCDYQGIIDGIKAVDIPKVKREIKGLKWEIEHWDEECRAAEDYIAEELRRY